MLTTVFLSKVFGFYFLILGIFLLTRQHLLKAVAEEFIHQKSSMFIVAIISTFFGIYILCGHNYWTMDWPVAITIIAWVIFIGGLFRLFFPDSAIKMARCMLKSPWYSYALGIFDLAVGAYLIYHVYFVHYARSW